MSELKPIVEDLPRRPPAADAVPIKVDIWGSLRTGDVLHLGGFSIHYCAQRIVINYGNHLTCELMPSDDKLLYAGATDGRILPQHVPAPWHRNPAPCNPH
jgi:hypothetical protein